jgi:hypothetical protein
LRNEGERLAIQWGIPLALAMLAVGARLLMSTDRLTLLGIIRGVVVGLFVGCAVNLYLTDITTIGDGTRGALVGAAAVLAEDLVVILMRVGKYLRNRPETVLDFIMNRGKNK